MSLESSIYVLSAFLGYLSAQVIKFAISLRKDGFHLRDITASGGMPSSHSSFMASITTVIGLVQGFDSAIFGLSFALLGIVVYDSVGVRRATGHNTLAIKDIKKSLKLKNTNTYSSLSMGHKPTEVLAGMIVGLATGLILYQLVF